MNALVKDCLKLVVITLVAGIALGAIYGITKDPIRVQEEKKQVEAYKNVFPDAAAFEDLEGFSTKSASKVIAANEANTVEDHGGDMINNVVVAKDSSGAALGYIFDATTSKGYGGDIQLTIGIKTDGTVTGYSVLSISETAGLGMNATKEEWASQFADKQVDTFTVVKDGSGASDDTKIDAISGATITSKAVTGLMNNCIAYFKTIEGGK